MRATSHYKGSHEVGKLINVGVNEKKKNEANPNKTKNSILKGLQ